MTVRKVFFNSRCPVCNAGVAHQRGLMESGGDADAVAACAIEWRDINDDPTALAARGVNIDDVRRKLYVEDDQGRLQVGAAAFAALWCDTPRQRWLGRLLQRAGLSTLARWSYDAFAAALYAWNRRNGRW